MLKFLRRRLAESLLSIAFLLVAVFFVSRMTGDPGRLYLPLDAPDEAVAEFNRTHGFDRPVLEQFAHFVAGLAKLDFGESIRRSEPALDVVMSAYPATLTLTAVTMLAALLGAVVIGCLAALRPTGWFDRLATVLSTTAASIPDFWLALAAIFFFAIKLHWLPTSGSGTPAHLVLPVLVLMLGPLGSLVQVVRGSMMQSLSAPFVEAAQARGIPPVRVVFIHALRNAAIPAITAAGVQAAGVLNGAVVIETVFAWPGIGRVLITAILQRDFAVVQAAVVIIALAILTLNLVVDVLYGLLDPRVRH